MRGMNFERGEMEEDGRSAAGTPVRVSPHCHYMRMGRPAEGAHQTIWITIVGNAVLKWTGDGGP